MTGPDASLVAFLGEHLAGTTLPVDPEWFADVCEHLTAAEIVAAIETAMRARGMPEAFIELCRPENLDNARTLARRT